jgi:hypothetical protein
MISNRSGLCRGTAAYVALLLLPSASFSADVDTVVRWLNVQIDTVQTQYEQLEQQLNDMRKQRDAALAVAQDAQRELADAERRAGDARKAVEQAKNELASARQEYQRAEAAMRLQHRNDIEHERREREKQVTAEVERAERRLTDERQRMQREIDQLKRELSKVRHDRDRYLQRYKNAKARVAQFEADKARHESVSCYNRGRAELAKNDCASAVKSFTAAIELYPYDARYFYLRGIARRQTGDQAAGEQAKSDADRGRRLESCDSPQPGVVDQALEYLQADKRSWLDGQRKLR